MKKILFLFFLIAPFGFVQAQTPGDSLSTVKIIKDPRLDMLIKKQVELNKEVYLQNARNMPGFRVLVINTNDRAKAIEIKTKLLQDFPEHKTYFFYQSPNFKVQIGNFRERQDAEALKKQVSRIYPEGVVVVPSPVDLKPELEEGID